MKIVSHYMGSIEGIEIFPIIAVLIFVSFFISLLYYLYHLDKGFVNDMGNMPLQDGNEQDNNQTKIKKT